MTGKDREVFTLLARQWDVTRARQLAEGKPIRQADITGLAGLLPFIVIDEGHAVTRDLSEPLLVVTTAEAGQVVIDGWHRIWKALNTGVGVLPIWLLNKDEEQQVRIR